MQPNLQIKISGDTRLNEKSLLIAKELVRKLNLPIDKAVTLQFGQSCYLMELVIDPLLSTDHLKINSAIISKTGIRPNRFYTIIYTGQSVRIGPYIGIAANLKADKTKPFAGQTFFVRQLIEQAQAMGAICFAFSLHDINYSQAQIRGYTYENNVWEKRLYPLPDVILPRSNNEINRHAFRRKLMQMGVHFFNPPGIGKWGTYKAMLKNPRLIEYLPITRLLNNFSELEGMLNKYPRVYVKPVTGSQGKNIVRISSNKRTGIYEYQYQVKQRRINEKANSLNELEHRLRLSLGKKRYLVQQQINLLRLKGSIMDLRVMTQKNRTGKWLVTGKVFRIGTFGSITSNISGGGSVGDIQSMLKLFFNHKRVKEIINEVEFLALETARTLEGRLGPIGELGIDIGVDQAGRVWLIEANLKPARRVFTLIGDNETRLLSVRRPIEYCIYLAGF